MRQDPALVRLREYFEYRRRDEIQKYRETILPWLRKDYRSWALHYGRLVRKLERGDDRLA